MKLIKIGAKQVLLQTNHGDEILYSSGNPVAGYVQGSYFKNRDFYSAESYAHAHTYLRNISVVTLLSPDEIEQMFLTGE
jgi:hypothetical protein